MSSAEILLHLTLPALEKLYLQLNIDETAFLHFLIRSSPPLRFLQLDSRATALSPALVKCLQTMHSLTELETHCRTECNWDILDTLTATPALLSNLQNIAVHGRTQSPEGYQRVVDFLASRRATIRRLHLAGDDARAFFEDVGPAVREFGEEGIDIIVGP
ncbi:hypothetical protein FB45DRAFT_938733 [Roridomyces roridus]|uniref:F-box domain-containing protein n=1 Tax=Roridomyces roridus TaxID=1738132 RepID=A0AAD7B7K0_9AGAR|nr:hypothetical protein FB45DRAFT_938733 [Roridomyces roridus]